MRNRSIFGDKVVPFSGGKPKMAYNPIAEVEAYWEALRGDRILPLRSEIDPRGMERALDHTFLLEKIAPGLARFRLAGGELNDVMGMEVRGMPLTALVEPAARDEARDILIDLFEGPTIITLDFLADRTSWSLGQLKAKMILLPLKSDLGDVSRALGCVQFEGKIGRTPRRMDIVSKHYRRLGEVEKIRHQPVKSKKPDPGFAEPRRTFQVLERKRAAGSHLRLVKSDQSLE